MSVELFHQGAHRCVMFSDLVADEEAVQANQFLIVNNGSGVILDPGGNMTYNELSLTMRKYVAPSQLDYILASHADPDIIASLDKWMTATQAKLVISSLWARFAPHFCKVGKTDDRIIGVPDEGARLAFGNTELWLLPAHFLHAEGNFQFYDPVIWVFRWLAVSRPRNSLPTCTLCPMVWKPFTAVTWSATKFSSFGCAWSASLMWQ